MTDKPLTITYGNRHGDAACWLRMELLEVDDSTMTVGEAADFIDAIYETDLCSGGSNSEPIVEPTAENWLNGFSTVDLQQCVVAGSFADPGAYDVAVKVYRSHQDEDYTLRLSHGTAAGPQRVTESVSLTLAVDNDDSLLLDVPVLGNFRAAWVDIDGPEIYLIGNLLYWSGQVTGTIRAEFVTVYDLWFIHVTGISNTDIFPTDGAESDQWLGVGWFSGDEEGDTPVDVRNNQCTVLAFYHYQYELLTLDSPAPDESVSDAELQDICYSAGSTDVLDCVEKCNRIVDDQTRADCLEGCKKPSDKWDIAACREECDRKYQPGADRIACRDNCERDCFTRKQYDTICSCGGDTGTEIIEERVQCPSGYNTGSNVGETVDGGTLYIDCGADSVILPEFYEQVCCMPLSGDMVLPKCVDLHEPYPGKQLSVDEISRLQQKYGDDVNIIMVGPSAGSCGEQVTSQKITGKCCDGVPEILWDYDKSVDVIADGSSGVVYVTGGRPPYVWKLSGSGFYADSAGTVVEAQTINPWLRIYTVDSCGSVAVSVSDGCSDLTEYVRSSVGNWLLTEGHTCPIAQSFLSYKTDVGHLYFVGGRYKVFQSWIGTGAGNKPPDCNGQWPLDACVLPEEPADVSTAIGPYTDGFDPLCGNYGLIMWRYDSPTGDYRRTAYPRGYDGVLDIDIYIWVC